MPQLSPLNWIFLFILFWSSILSLSVLIWWTSKIFYESKSFISLSEEKNKWNW
uniref:ATP synthase F0 subunit 8 n=1 Tax=Neptuneopsis gilchristi TaxID=2695884 RepID=A0A6B9QEQ6_9CAEN|nr:ATP synthase F0 subunit 8 [Neptuneopsis gilchristi]